MFKKIIFFAIFSVASSSVLAAGLDEYVANVKNQCPGINQLIIKKSLIELTQGQNCNGLFTNLLLKECPGLSCSDLLSHLSSLNSSKSGSVIGK